MAAAFGLLLAVPRLRSFFDLDIPPLVVVVSAVGIAVAAIATLEAGRWVVDEYQRDRLADQRAAARRLLAFLAARLRPEGALGLSLTILLALLATAGVALGAVVQDVIAGNDSARLDRPTLEFFARHRQPWLTTSARAAATLGSTTVVVAVVVVVGVWWWWRRRTTRPLLLLSLAYLGSAALFRLISLATNRPRPPGTLAVGHIAGSAFPSGHATQAAAVWGMLATVTAAAFSAWRPRVASWVVAAVVVAAVGTSGVYLGAHWVTDVFAGWALGALWLFAVLSAARAVDAAHGIPNRDPPVREQPHR
jgi:membrane-associated phospholipid phosphatase